MDLSLYQIGRNMKELEIRLEKIEQTLSELTTAKVNNGSCKTQDAFAQNIMLDDNNEPLKSYPVNMFVKFKAMHPDGCPYKVLSLIRIHPNIKINEIIKCIDEVPNNIYSAINGLLNRNIIKKTEDGGFRVIYDKTEIQKLITINGKPKRLNKNGNPYKAWLLIKKTPGLCLHDISEKLEITIKDSSNLLHRLAKKGIISRTEKYVNCRHSNWPHYGYVIRDQSQPLTSKIKIVKKQKKYGMITKNSKEARILQIIEDNPEICVHNILNIYNENHHKPSTPMKINNIINVLLKKGRIEPLSVKKICKDSQYIHRHYKTTMPITENTFRNIQKKQCNQQQNQYEKELKEKTRELDFDDFDRWL